jgi:hypothetical protein
MKKEHGPRFTLTDPDGWHVQAVWSRSGKRLGLSMFKDSDFWQVELTPDQVKDLIRFLTQTTPDP